VRKDKRNPDGRGASRPSKKGAFKGATPTVSRVRDEKSNKEASKRTKNERGASLSSVSTREQWRSYWQNHKKVLRDSLSRLIQTPFPTLMTIGVIAIALALPAGLFVLLKNAQTLSRDWDGNAQISVYLQQEVSAKEGKALSDEIAERKDIARVQYISQEQALEEFIAISGFGDVLKGLEENPLPAVIVAYPKTNNAERAELIRASLEKMPGVELAQLDAEWVRKLHSIIELGERLVTALGLGLALAVLLVIINTIRLAIENRRDEIVIVKLVGGTDAFVRRPFLYTGFWYGLGGGFFAIVLVELTLLWMDNPVAELSNLYDSDYVLAGLGVGNAAFIVLLSVGVGLAGAWVAVGRHLKEVEPS